MHSLMMVNHKLKYVADFLTFKCIGVVDRQVLVLMLWSHNGMNHLKVRICTPNVNSLLRVHGHVNNSDNINNEHKGRENW
jgi:hypothetical protein